MATAIGLAHACGAGHACIGIERAKASTHLDFGLTVLAQCLSRYALNCQHGKYDLVL